MHGSNNKIINFVAIHIARTTDRIARRITCSCAEYSEAAEGYSEVNIDYCCSRALTEEQVSSTGVGAT